MGGFIRALMLLLLLQVGVATSGLTGSAVAQEAPAAAPNPKVEELLRLLSDPDVQSWIEKAAVSAPASTPGSTPAVPAVTEAEEQLTAWEGAFRQHIVDMGTALRRLPSEIGTAVSALSAEGRGIGIVILALAVLVAIGYGVERLVGRLLSEKVSQVAGSSGDPATTALSRLVPVLVFAVTSLVLLMFIGGGPLFRRVVLLFLVAIVLSRAVAAVSSLIAALVRYQPPVASVQQAEPVAVAEVVSVGQASPTLVVVDAVPEAVVIPEAAAVPEPAVTVAATDAASGFWERRINIFVAYFLVAWAMLASLRGLGMSADGVRLLAYLAGIGLVVICVEAIWRGPRLASGERSVAKKWMLTLFVVLLWCVWSVGLTLLLWLGIYALLLPPLLQIAGRATAAVVERRAKTTGALLRTREVLFVRGVRALIILAAVLWLGYILRFSPGVLADNEMIGGQLARAVLRGILILLVADLIWHLAKAYIDSSIAEADLAPAEVARRSRIRTLLPIFRIALAVLITTVAGLMVLSELGVQVGPLIAGAGIFGVAIGFGSQTLVKDIISGMFYLMDDAFRVGEYIQSGSFKGTVEGFSLRSVRLRHHRGPVFTVPFGSLGAVQNMSRDWVIDKFMLRLPFDTDIKLVKKLTKQVGARLLEDPDAGPVILETVKMKGVEQIGDYGMDISFAMKTKPGNQTSVRRRAYAMLRDTFASNGIEFARPSFNVAGDDNPNASTAAALAEKTRMDQAKLAQQG